MWLKLLTRSLRPLASTFESGTGGAAMVRRGICRVGAAAAVVGGSALVWPPSPAEAHFDYCNGVYMRWPGNQVDYWQNNMPYDYPAALLNAENSFDGRTVFSFGRTSSPPWQSGSTAKIAAYWVNDQNMGASAITAFFWDGNCRLTDARIEFNHYKMSGYSTAKKQSTSAHELMHAIGGNAKTADGKAWDTEVNDGCSLWSLFQQSDSCRWDTKGINVPQYHDSSDIDWVY